MSFRREFLTIKHLTKPCGFLKSPSAKTIPTLSALFSIKERTKNGFWKFLLKLEFWNPCYFMGTKFGPGPNSIR